MDNCIFCKIIQKQIPCYDIYEDKHFLAFLDVKPRNKGHCLIISKKHYRWVWDVQEEYSAVANKIANGLKKAFQTDFVVSFVIGEEVPHAHIHLVPRFTNDGHGALIDLHAVKSFSAEEMKQFQHQLRAAL